MYLPLVVPNKRTFGEDVGFLTPFNSLAHHLFGVAQPINGGSIDPVDAKAEGMFDGGDRFVVVLRTPTSGPTTTSHCPCSQTNWCNVYICLAKLACFHTVCLLSPDSGELLGCFLLHVSLSVRDTRLISIEGPSSAVRSGTIKDGLTHNNRQRSLS